MSARSGGRFGNIAAYAAGNITYNVSQWGIVVVLANVGPQSLLGAYTYALALAAPAMLLAGLSLRQIAVTEPEESFRFSEFFVTRVVTTSVALALLTVLGSLQGQLSIVYVTVIICKAIDLVADIIGAPLQRRGALVAIGIGQGINGLLSLGGIVAAIALGASPEFAVVVSGLGSLGGLAFVVHSWLESRDAAKEQCFIAELGGLWRSFLRLSVRRRVLSLCVTSLPLGIASMAASLRTNVPKYFIEYFHSIEAVGVFSAIAYFVVAGNTLVAAMAQYELPNVAGAFHKDGCGAMVQVIFRNCVIWSIVAVVAVIAAALAGGPLLRALYGEGFEAHLVIEVLAIAWGFGAVAWMVEQGLVAMREFRLQLIANFGAVFVTVVASGLLIPSVGLLGAAVATAAGGCALLGLKILFLGLCVRRASGG